MGCTTYWMRGKGVKPSLISIRTGGGASQHFVKQLDSAIRKEKRIEVAGLQFRKFY